MFTFNKKNVRRATMSAATAAVALACAPAHAQTPGQGAEAQIAKRLDELAAEIARLKSELQQVKNQQATAAAPAPAPAPGLVTNAGASTSTSTGAGAGAGADTSTSGPATQITSYGEIAYTRPRRDTSATQIDVGRLVLGFNHRVDERTKIVAELETEHAVTSATDSGEVAVEQLVIEHRIHPTYGLRAGLFLMPIGLVNQNHEPTSYYGNFRPTVETAIIPSTLREVGLQLFGEHDNGVTWAAGISTGPDLTKWDPLDAGGVESPLRAVHQEGQFAKSKDLSLFGALDWRGIPGLRLGAGVISGKMGHGKAGFAAPNARYTLWDVHANFNIAGFDLSALYAKGQISGAGALNATFGPGVFLVPKTFDGAYVQAAYKLRLGSSYSIAPFVRLEQVNTGRSFDGVAGAPAYRTEGITSVGVNFNLTPAVVFKADLQRFKVVKDSDRFNLGMGYSF
jgi:hypothetical protein